VRRVCRPSPAERLELKKSDDSAIRRTLADALAPMVARWPDFWFDLFTRDVAAGHVAAWAAPQWFAEQLPAPLLNAVGREFEQALWADQLANGVRSVFELTAYNQAADWRARNVRNLFHPGDFFGEFMHGFPREGVDYALDGVAAEQVARLLAEGRGYLQEIERLRVRAAVRELGAGSLTPPALTVSMSESERPPAVRNPAVPLVADTPYLRARAWDPAQVVIDARLPPDPDIYRTLVPAIAGWQLDTRLARKDADIFTSSAGGELYWALEVAKPSVHDIRFPELVLCGAGRSAPRLILPGGAARQVPEFAMSDRGREVHLRQEWARFTAVMQFYEPALPRR